MRPLRVAVDATPMINGDTGVAQYASQHLLHLRDHEHVQVSTFTIGRGPRLPGARRTRIPLRLVHRSWSLFGQPSARVVNGGDFDLVHSIDMIAPPTRKPVIVTLHDVLPLEHPRLYGPRFVRIARAGLKSARLATLVVTTCESTAERIAEVGDIPRSRIVVAPPGRRDELGVVEPVLDHPYLLAVGTVTPRKAFHVLCQAIGQLGDEVPPLVVAGPDGWHAEVVHRAAERPEVARRVRLLGRVDDTTLERLYRHATAVCHPSTAEGFGIPCLEAMGFGVPVVAADIPSIREMGAGAIELCEAGDPDALAEALRRVVHDPARAQEMAVEGRKRASGYTWQRMTSLIVDAYTRAATAA